MFQGPPIPNFSNIPFVKPIQACPMKKQTPSEPATNFIPAPIVPNFNSTFQQPQQPPQFPFQQPKQENMVRVGAYDDILMQTRPKHVPGQMVQPLPQTPKGPVIVASDPPPFYNADSVSMGSMKMTYAAPPIVQQFQQNPTQQQQQPFYGTTKPSFESGFVNTIDDAGAIVPPERPGAPSPSDPIDLFSQAEAFLKSHASEVVVAPTPQMSFATKPKSVTSFPNIIDVETWKRNFSTMVLQDEHFLNQCFASVTRDVETMTQEIVDSFVFDKLVSRYRSIQTPFLVKNASRTPIVKCALCGYISDPLKLIQSPGQSTYEGSSLDQIQKKLVINKSVCQNPLCEVPFNDSAVLSGWKNVAIIQGGTDFGSLKKEEQVEDGTLYKKPPTSVMQKQMILKDADDTLGGFEYQKPNTSTTADGGVVTEIKEEIPPTIKESDFKFARTQIVGETFLDHIFDLSQTYPNDALLCFSEIGNVMRNFIGETHTKKEDIVFKKSLSQNIVLAFCQKNDVKTTVDEERAKFFIPSWDATKFTYNLKEDQFLAKRPSSMTMNDLFKAKKFSTWLPLLVMSQAVAILHELTGVSDKEPENEKQPFMYWRESQPNELQNFSDSRNVSKWKLHISLFRYAHLLEQPLCTLDIFQRKGQTVITLELDMNAFVYYFLGCGLRQDESRSHIWLSFPFSSCPFQSAIFTLTPSDFLDEVKVKFFRALKQSGNRVLNVQEIFSTKEDCFKWADERGIRNAIVLDKTFSPDATTAFDFKAIVSDRKTLQQQPQSFLDISSFMQAQK